MSGTVGDKIGFTAPTVGGDSDTWGTILNSLFTVWDENHYAAREDRNLVIFGGGRIAWTASSGVLSFSSAIDIRNHVTSFKNSITTAASPITLDASHKVAYVALTRKPGSDTNITSATVVAAGALPNTTSDGDNANFVLAYRTADSTVIIPWARREILDGDHWQFGAAQSWYERLASHAKPSYKSTTDTSQVIVPGSAAAPAVIFINGKLYANVADETMDLDTAGRNGLDTGAKAANTSYYLYAIPSASGRTFDTVCSITAPTGAGPTGFTTEWSYIGGFSTNEGASTITPFQSTNGIYQADHQIEDRAHTGNTTQTLQTYNSLPTTAKAALVLLQTSGATTNSVARVMGSNTSGNNALPQSTQVNGIDNWIKGLVPIFTQQVIYLQLAASGNSVTGYLMGWIENPMEYR